MTRIQEVLLSLLRYGPVDDAARPADLSSLTPADWALLLEETNRHGLKPFLYNRLRNSAVPAPVNEDLRRAHLLNAATNARRFHFLGLALQALDAAGVPVIVLKGAYLAEAVYENPALRTMGDVDLLVRREDLPMADTALRAAGYVPQEFHLDPPADANEFHYFHQKSMGMLELHWEIVNPEYPFSLKPSLVWPSAVPVRIAETDAFALSPEDLICHLGIHAAIHAYNMGLKAVVDVAESISRLPVDWTRFKERAREARAARPVWMLLALAGQMLGAAVPEGVLSELRPTDTVPSLLETAREAVLLNRSDRQSAAVGNPNLLLFLGRKGIPAKLSLAFRKAFPSRLAIAGMYPVPPKSLRVYLYYPRWILTLIKRNAPAVRAEMSARGKKNAVPTHREKSAAMMDWLIGG